MQLTFERYLTRSSRLFRVQKAYGKVARCQLYASASFTLSSLKRVVIDRFQSKPRNDSQKVRQ